MLACSLVCTMAFGSNVGWADPPTTLNLGEDSASMVSDDLSNELQNQVAAYPSSFDLRSVDTDGDGVGDTAYVTPVKNQRPFGDCWGFASTATAESAVLSDMLQYGNQPSEPLDFSEKHSARRGQRLQIFGLLKYCLYPSRVVVFQYRICFSGQR